MTDTGKARAAASRTTADLKELVVELCSEIEDLREERRDMLEEAENREELLVALVVALEHAQQRITEKQDGQS